jgi:iron complex transport system ATP-binding protein
MTHQLQLVNVSVSYPGRNLLNDVSLTIESGSLTSLQGRNGTGKSSLLRCLTGLQSPAGGSVQINNISISSMTHLERSRFIGALWTDRMRIPGITLRELIRMGTYNAQRTSNEKELNALTDECMAALGLSALADRALDQLSDGELQKGMIARALAQRPSFLILDEPTTYLDYVAKEELMTTLKQVGRSVGIGVFFTSHDLEIISRYADTRYELIDAGIRRIS